MKQQNQKISQQIQQISQQVQQNTKQKPSTLNLEFLVRQRKFPDNMPGQTSCQHNHTFFNNRKKYASQQNEFSLVISQLRDINFDRPVFSQPKIDSISELKKFFINSGLGKRKTILEELNQQHSAQNSSNNAYRS